MPNYKYSAIGADGRTVSGRLDASSKADCVAELRKQNLTPLDVQERGRSKAQNVAPEGATSAVVGRGPRRGMRVGRTRPGVRKREEVTLFTRQLSTMISAGIPLLESL